MIMKSTIQVAAATIALGMTSGSIWAIDSEREMARAILDAADVSGGLVAHVGCGDGKLTAALGANDRYLVHGIDVDEATIARARANILAAGKYGQISVDTFDGRQLPYADNGVKLLVSSDSESQVSATAGIKGVGSLLVSRSLVRRLFPRASTRAKR